MLAVSCSKLPKKLARIQKDQPVGENYFGAQYTFNNKTRPTKENTMVVLNPKGKCLKKVRSGPPICFERL